MAWIEIETIFIQKKEKAVFYKYINSKKGVRGISLFTRSAGNMTTEDKKAFFTSVTIR